MGKHKVTSSTPIDKDVIYFFLLNVASAFMLSAAHNVLYFVLDIKTTAIHFLHFLFTFLFMSLLFKMGTIPRTRLPIKLFTMPVVMKTIETFLSAITHSQNRTGGLFVVRVFDFLFTLVVVFLRSAYVDSRRNGPPKAIHVIPLGFAVSLAWLEFGQMEYTTISLLAAPLLAISRALSLLSIQKSFVQIERGHIEQYIIYFSGIMTAVLALPAFISYMGTDVQVTASWESIDYVLMGMSFVFMASNLYSDLWLALNVNARAYATLDHTKYLGASFCQWFIQNMAHPNILALGGKILGLGCLFRIWTHL